MGSSGPAEMPCNPEAPLPALPKRPALEPVRNWAPHVPRWHLEQLPPLSPSEVQEEQMQFMAQIFAKEIQDHNTTRIRLQHYLMLQMRHERGLYSERAHVQHLITVVHDLQTQIQDEKAKRIAAEETQVMLLQNDGLDNFSCGYPTVGDQSDIPPPADSAMFTSPTEEQVDRSNNENSYLQPMAPLAVEPSKIQAAPNSISSLLCWPLVQPTSPEDFALESHELNHVKDEEEIQEGRRGTKGRNKRRHCQSMDGGSPQDRAPKYSKHGI